jgi:hypothetical protein
VVVASKGGAPLTRPGTTTCVRIAKMPAFADYENRTTRRIPVVVLERI